MIAEVLIEIKNVAINKTFTYLVPNDMENIISIGMRVKVPFGSQNIEGFVLKIDKLDKVDVELKEITSLVDQFSILDQELLDLGKYVSENTLTPLITCYQTMLPKALKARSKVNMIPTYIKYISLTNEVNTDDFKGTQKEIIKKLLNGKILKKELEQISISSIKTLLNKNIIKEELVETYRLNLKDEEKTNFNLYPEQQKVCDTVLEYLNKNEIFLLHGVTGSGKTNVYMKIIVEVIKQGKQVIVLVPEISLTPQIIKRFTSMFDRIAILHSRLSDGEKYDEWRKIKRGKVDIVIGARSAIFAPFNNLGLIVIDEEHSTTYKQENQPRYNTLDVAKYRSNYHHCPIVLGSATPSLESYARAQKGIYHLLELKERANKKDLPEVEIIDMNKEFKKSNGFFSKKLMDKIQEKIDLGEQIILFLNRRGYANFVTCQSCGEVFKCPNCDISLTYHKTSNMLRCHYCGYATSKPDKCPSCHEELVNYGLGTEQVEEQLNKMISNSKIVRMDIDTTSKKGAHEAIINDFMNNKYNILLGTQMIAKGLDFPNVTLVGVINADISLNFPDFRSSEYTFQLLNQVAGRSGRGEKSGEVIIQTFNPDHYALEYAKNNDYLSFYNHEMDIRKTLGYSPYYYLISLKIISNSYDNARDESNKIMKKLKEKIPNGIILGPSMANVFKVNNKYRFQIIIKYKTIGNIKIILSEINNHYFNNKSIKLEIDFDPAKI